jgi:hypothetical protein
MANIKIKQGDTATVLCNVTENGNVFNLTNYQAKMCFLGDEDDIEATIEAPATGVLKFDFTHSWTKDKHGDYPYEIKVYKADLSDVKTVENGSVAITKAIEIIENEA